MKTAAELDTLFAGRADRKPGDILPASECGLGDIVTLPNWDSIYTAMTVVNKTETLVTAFRVYVTVADFTYTGGVIPYIGTEHVHLNHTDKVKLLRLSNIRKSL